MAGTKIYAGKKIRAVREVKGYKQDWLANKIGITQPALSKIESDETMVDYETLVQIAAALEVDIDEMMNFERANVFNNCNQSGTFAGSNNTFTFSGDSKEFVQQLTAEKDRIIFEQAERIRLLERQLSNK